MSKLRFLAVVIFTLAVASMAQAQASRTWVSGVGDDANPCSRTAPCKTFAGAISKTAAGGEISVLDPGGFGGLTVTKSITVNGEGTLAGVLNALVNGIVINALTTDNVTIRNISINSPHNGLDGVRILSAKSVTIENSTISGSGDGIEILASNNVNVMVNNCQIKNNTAFGIKADTSSGLARVTVKNSAITNNGTAGVNARRNSRVSMIDTSVSFNALGIHVEGNGATAVAVLKNCQITNNTSHGIQAGGGASNTTSVARISGNIINNNAGSGVSIAASGSVESFLNNEITGNNPDGCVGCINISGNFQ